MSTGSGWAQLDLEERRRLEIGEGPHAEVKPERPKEAESEPKPGGVAPGTAEEEAPPGLRTRLARRILALFGLPRRRKVAPTPTYEERYPRPPEWRRKVPARDLAGLALSGGGIRSATFNLGLLQGLHRAGLLGSFDYLSTVSGGGYVGGFWSAWRSTGRPCTQHLFPGEGPDHRRPEPGEIRHLREFSNFLRPRLRLLSFETGRIVATLAGGILPCIVLALAVVVLALLAWWGVHWAFTAEVAGREGLLDAIGRGCLLLVFTLAVQTAFELVWLRNTEQPEARATAWYALWAAGGAVVAAFVWTLLWHTALPPWLALAPLAPENVAAGAAVVLPPAVAWTVAVLVLVVVRSLLSDQARRSIEGRFRQGALDRALARTFFCAVAWIALGALWLVGQLLAFGGVDAVLTAAGVGGASGGGFAYMRRFLTAQTNKPTGGKLTARAGPWLFQALAYLTLGAVITAMAALLVLLYDASGLAGLAGALLTALAVLVLSLLFNPHEVGLHGFYRDRLVRAYLGASNLGAPARATAICREDDVPLTCLPDKPLHLVCCAANDLSGDPLGTLHRGAESAVLSKLGFQVGDRWKPWATRENGTARRGPTLGDAMTASAAAFNSHMGQVSMRLGQAATFLLTALGLRLGLWIENPERGEPGSKRPSGHLILRELFGDSRTDRRWIHLSDAAHFENLALYELVRRHCRFILLSDCGADPDRAFDDFGNVVRRVREDFGVEIRIDVSPLRPGEDGRSRQPMVAGDVVYPPSEPGGPQDHGILLYVKPTLTGNEPPDIAQYARRNERFPHETTIDQFYDEAQWESYRRLGEYAAEQALTAITQAGRGSRGLSNLSLFFLSARYHWPPLPGEEPLLRELDAEWARLDTSLQGEELEAFRRQLLQPEPARRNDGDSPEKRDQRPVEPEFPEAALPLVREAVRIMEAVYLRTGFGQDERSPSHRRYMGWLNRFGTWASAPDFQRCWPWLEPFLTRDFVVFMHQTFSGLKERSFADVAIRSESDAPAPRAWSVVRELTDGETGYARRRWEAREERPEASGSRLYGFFLQPAGRGGPELNAGVVEIHEEAEPERNRDRDRDLRRTACWGRDSFYVAAGLWGLGIGEAFLARLVRTLKQEEWTHARVHVGGEPSAADDALYSGAGFLRDPTPGHTDCFVLDLGTLEDEP